MKLIYKGKFSGDINTLPQRETDFARRLTGPDNMLSLSVFQTSISMLIIVLTLIPVKFSMGNMYTYSSKHLVSFLIVGICLMISPIPHELLHAVCFKGDVYLYTNLKQGCFFVVGSEDMSKTRYIMTSMLPNIIFGIIPYLIFVLYPDTCVWFGYFGCLSLGAGAGDFINVVSAILQVPDYGTCFTSGMNTYWYSKE